MKFETNYLDSIQKQFEYYKSLGDKTFEQLNNQDIYFQYNEESNSISIIVKHIVGNMLSRWTNFLEEDGEKEWRKRDDEFIDSFKNKDEMLLAWEKGWTCLFKALKAINETNFSTVVYIRNEGHTITEALNRQSCHYSYHIGQLVFLGKMIQNTEWQTLSIAKNSSKAYNAMRFKAKKSRKQFTDNL